MKKFLKATVLMLTAVITLSVSGCSLNYNLKEECSIESSVDTISYTYSEKVRVEMSSSSNYRDALLIKTNDEYSEWVTILENDFTKAAWHDYKIFILIDNTYYMFDISAYDPSAIGNDELKVYSEGEMKNLYPVYEAFDWYQPYKDDIE